MSLKSYDHTCNNILVRTHNITENFCVNNDFLIEIMFVSKAINSHFKGSYDKLNFTLVAISYEIR